MSNSSTLKLQTHHKTYITHLLLTATICTAIFYITPISALLCSCNVCPGDAEVCTTSDHSESVCYMSVEKVLENGTVTLQASYGCISGHWGSLAHLQCHVKSTVHREQPRFISCCKDRDYCNYNLTNPTEQDDVRWKPEPPVATPDVRELAMSWQILIIFSSTIVIIYYLMKIIFMTSLRYFKTSSKQSQGSSCSLKPDCDKLHRHFATSSSSSTHSYSMSDDSCKKSADQTNGDTSIPIDVTSGKGGQVLTQRTIARAIGCGKTDFVGDGRFGRVFRGQYHGEDVAVKAFKTIDSDAWEREDTVFRSLNHENIVRFIASELTNTSEIWMFLEYCTYGSLCDYLDNNEIMGPSHATKILYSIISGLNYLHEDYAQSSRVYKPSIAHRDIKSKNILMRTPEVCCLADFGHVLIKVDENTLDYGKYRHIQVGTVRYMAPEILKPVFGLNYREFETFAQADLYQYGLVVWEVCHRTALDIIHPAGPHKLPYDGVVPDNPGIGDMIKIVCEDQYRPEMFEKWDKYPMMKRLADLMVECWRPNPKARMQTLGVKKKIKEMYDQIMPAANFPFHVNIFNNVSHSPNLINDKDKTKSTDVTM